jgi:hypothetical protein
MERDRERLGSHSTFEATPNDPRTSLWATPLKGPVRPCCRPSLQSQWTLEHHPSHVKDIAVSDKCVLNSELSKGAIALGRASVLRSMKLSVTGK